MLRLVIFYSYFKCYIIIIIIIFKLFILIVKFCVISINAYLS